MLAAKGLVVSKPKAGTRVRERLEWNLLDPELLAWMFEGEPPAGFVTSLFQLRLIVEPAAAELAAVKRDTRQLSRMGRAGGDGRARAPHRTGPRRRPAVPQHHLEATANELLISLSGSIGAAVRWTTLYKHRSAKQPRDSMPEHRHLFAAIAEADAAAARAATIVLVEQAREDTERALAR